MLRHTYTTHKINIPRDVYKLFTKKLTLSEFANFALAHPDDHASYQTFLNAALNDPPLLLRELSSLELDKISQFLIQYHDQINLSCDRALQNIDSNNLMPAVVLKALVMPIADAKNGVITPDMLEHAYEFLVNEEFPAHLIESMKFQGVLVGLARSKEFNEHDYTASRNDSFEMWGFNHPYPCSVDCIKNLRGITFGMQSLDIPQSKTYWKHANFQDSDLSKVSFSGASLAGAHIPFTDQNLSFILYNYYMFKSVPIVNYVSANCHPDNLKSILDNLYSIVSGSNQVAIRIAEDEAKTLLYSTAQHKHDGFDAKKLCSEIFPLIIADITKQLLIAVSGVDARAGHDQRLGMLFCALNHPLFATKQKLSERLVSMFSSSVLTDAQKLIKQEMVKYQDAQVEFQKRGRK